VAERELGVPQLLDVDYVVDTESPDQFFIMTYVAQLYHKFSVTDSGYDSTVNNSFKYSSSEEDSPRKSLEPPGKRRGTAGHPSDWKKRRPVGLVVSGGLELRLDSPKHEEVGNGNGSKVEQQLQGATKLYDADDEEGESSEVILSRGSGAITEAADTATPLLPHQDLVFKRKRPNSLTRVSNSSAEKENTTKWKPERRSGKRGTKQPKAPEVTKRKIIGVSDFPKPYKTRTSTVPGGICQTEGGTTVLRARRTPAWRTIPARSTDILTSRSGRKCERSPTI